MSGISYSRLRGLTVRQIIQALKRDRFYLDHATGSHYLFRHPDGRKVTISFHHSGDTFKPDILKSIIEKQAQWTEDDLRRLKLLK